jgi:hypothetical protein
MRGFVYALIGVAALMATHLPPAVADAAPGSVSGAILELPTDTTPDGCRDNVLPANDDGSTGPVALPFTPNFFGSTYGSLYVNNNGNVTFDGSLSTFTPFDLLSTTQVIIAPFFADVDTRGSGSGVVTYGATTFGGRTAFCVDWVGVGYYSGGTDKLNDAQLVLVDRSDVASGDFDVIMNFGRVQWEAGSASGGSGGLGGASARVGYSNGISVALELPGSAVNGALLDSNTTSGLVHGSRDSVQLGRYVFPVRNGSAPTGGTITGTIYRNAATPGNELLGAFVQVCGTQGACNLSSTSASGTYSVSGLAPDVYTVKAFPPAGTNLSTGTSAPITIVDAETVGDADIVLEGPVPPPAGTTITSRYVNPGGMPIVYWNEPLTLTTSGCEGGSASYPLTLASGNVIRSGAMTEGPVGTYTAAIAALYPDHGDARVDIAISCPDGSSSQFAFAIYIDPSGLVRTVDGDPVVGATVTLFRSDSAAGPFEQVPDGSGLMSVANRTNPDLTDAGGHFGWDVVAGFYKVRAQKDGCASPDDPQSPFVETAVLTIPPPVTDLDLRLACNGVTPTTSSSTTTSTTPTTTTTSTLPSGCSIEPTFPSVVCRTDDLIDDVASAGLSPSITRNLSRTLTTARLKAERAEQYAMAGRSSSAGNQLKAAIRRLVTFEFRLRSRRGRRGVDEGSRSAFSARSSEIRKDATMLLGTL